MQLTFTVILRNGDAEELTVPVSRVLNCGLTGPEEEVQRHITELEKEGISIPDELPAMYPLPRQQLMQCSTVEVLTDMTSGEVEIVLVPTDEEVYVGVGSDHTDRDMETESVPLSKAVCPNVISDTLWRLSEIERHWDALRLRSWTGFDGQISAYQDGTLDQVMAPRDLLAEAKERMNAPLPGTVVFSGTVSTEAGELVRGDVFAARLVDPILDRSLGLEYDVVEPEWFEE